MKISIEWLKEYVEIEVSPWQLKEDLTMAGLVVESVSEIPGDSVLELEVTSNRPDCLSHIGVAREVAALYKKSLRMPATRRRLKARQERLPYSIEIRDLDLCPRYVGLVMDGIRVGPAPEWMQRRLEAAGMRPVNNIVDITNYVLLEYGHPLHAFDFKRIQQGKIIAGRAVPSQKMTTLDGIERELDGEMLLISDAGGAVAIAGVMGGESSEISITTQEILLECAYFSPTSVRRTSKKLGLSTEASYRFERGADWNGTLPAIARTCFLIEKYAHGRIAGSVQDVYPRLIDPVQISLFGERVDQLLGVKMQDAFIEETLGNLGFKVSRKGRRCWLVTCPTFRADMELEADLVEEIARFHGYQNIPTTSPAGKSAGQPSPASPVVNSARRILLGLGYSEAINLSFANEIEFSMFPSSSVDRVALRNPLTEDTQFLRTSIVPGLVKSAKRNFNFGNYHVRLFELGHVFQSAGDGLAGERTCLGILGTGSIAGFNWHNPIECYDYFHLKGIMTAFLRAMHGSDADIRPTSQVSWLNPSNASSIMVEGKSVGVMGSLHPSLQEELKFRQQVFLAELDFTELSRYLLQPVRYASLAKYPAVERDLSLIVSKQTRYSDMEVGIAGLGIPELRCVLLIDVYEGEKIPQGRISMTLRFTFQDREATLTVDRVQGFSDNILDFLSTKYNAELRYQL